MSTGVSDQQLVLEGGSLGPRIYFQLVWTSFWIRGTIFEQFIVTGFINDLVEKQIRGYPKNCPSYINFPQQKKNSSIFLKEEKSNLKWL